MPCVLSIAIDRAGRRHPFERVKQIEISFKDSHPLQREQHRHRTAAAPDSAFHEAAGDVVFHDVFDGVAERSHAFATGHRVRLDLPKNDVVRTPRRLSVLASDAVDAVRVCLLVSAVA